ncbi:Twin-arginine translocation pathway signal [Streptomyces sp. NBC_00237]|uniref:Twin-arginine translocation pathway signal n=1 Tax=Streptomyces sp. NBC_00237 TaxID=2975687 RepID=UPI00224D21AC|nr:Twin-arginine translocation pathway signal [Streptomyces sp. NBC_00237]MCX5206019.1 Twin-arginine translocation pathway signal [Streptomyces sp. NBC_00237]
MTTDAGLPAVRESLHLALLVDPAGSSTVVDLAQAAVEHYATHYNRHPPALLFSEVRAARALLTEALIEPVILDSVAVELRRTVGWLSALLGNASFHCDDTSGARAHLAAALTYGTRSGDARLTTWVLGAQSMLARSAGQYDSALALAEQGLALAPPALARAQIHAWAQLPALAGQGRTAEADAALADARRALDADPTGFAPGRFGFDAAELALHEAEAHARLGRTAQATTCAETSLTACLPDTPGWAAASLVLAQAEAAEQPTDAAQRAVGVLDRIPAARLRSTARDRLIRLGRQLGTTDAAGVTELHDRIRTLPPHIDSHGAATA